mgnify:FL=1|tara:strand:+ start:5870 stop:6496 length:627 start_codon:yes stop_codon:yes gene_type:complete
MNNLSTLKWKEFRDYTVDTIRSATVDWDPYWHVLIKNTFHPDLFTLIKTEWPDFETCNYRKNVTGFNQNRKIYNPEQPDGLPFWYEYYKNIINHKDIQDAVYSLDDLVNNCCGTTSSIWEDYRGYSVSNHYDAHTIQVAWQAYIHCSGGEGWGTSLNDVDGNCIKKFSFTPNTSWLMRVDANSWHSCDEVDCDVRQSVMVRFMTKSRN